MTTGAHSPSKDGSVPAKATETKTFKVPKNNKRNFGLIGQHVRSVLKKRGVSDFAGITEGKGGGSMLSMDYSQFIAPLIKSVQELDGLRKANADLITSLQNIVATQQKQLSEQQAQIDRLNAKIGL